ncbi:hypothetical protein SNE40_016924 [Patella caerulea]|uniref:Uncharacterized protein n=1 Tax=Patella caerulea TaxID=87958 RepID=A0AAN8JFH8_PATCE
MVRQYLMMPALNRTGHITSPCLKPHLYIDTDAVNTRDLSNTGYINSDTSRSPYEVLDKQTTDQQPNSYQQLDTPSTYEVLDKQTTDQQPNTNNSAPTKCNMRWK